MAEQKDAANLMPKRLRSIQELNEAHEWLFHQSRTGQIDSKTTDTLNTVLKGSVYLNAKLRLDYFKLLLQAQVKKVEVPKGLLPEITS